MTTKTISTYIAAGYTLSASYSQLVITAKGGVGGTGVIAHSHATVTNSGKVNGDVTTGIDLTAGGNVINEVGGLVTGPTAIEDTTGRVTNYGKIEATGAHYAIVFSAGGTVINGSYATTNALISGDGVEIVGGLGTVTNLATIKGTAYLLAGGKVTNGAAGDTTALIDAGDGVVIANAAGTVSNYASIQGYATSGASGVYLRDGGGVANGSSVDTSARIEGGTGVEIRYAASVANFGAIVGTSASYGAGGVALHNGGVVTNGSATDRGASIQGYFGVLIESTAGTVINFGVITGEGPPNGVAGVSLAAGGRVTNGTGDDTGALIQGASGVALGGAGTVVNSGTVDGASSEGVLLEHGGLVTNGGAGDRSALISGYRAGVLAFGATATVKNFGTVLGTGGGAFQPRAVRLLYGGVLINGSPNNSTALVEAYFGAALYVTGASTNFGTILGTGDLGGSGATLGGGVSLQNGASGHATALVEGYTGVTATGTANTLTNFGVIAGAAGYAVDFDSPTDVLVVEAGSAFSGAINGGGGTLALGDGAWTHAGFLSAAGSITLSGPIAATTFGDFGTFEVGAGASLTATGTGTVFAGQGLIVAGTLTTGGAITSAGTLTVTGALAGAGTLLVTGGAASFTGTPSLTIAKVKQSGGLITFGGAAITAGDVWTQTAGTITGLIGDEVDFTGVGDVFSGTLSGTGIIAFTGGTDLISGATLAGSRLVVDGASVTLSGAIAISGELLVTSPDLIIAAAGATLSGGGTLDLTDLATNAIKGASAAATLTNAAGIFGSGDIGGGQMTLVNQAGGFILANQTNALILDTGAATIINAGIIATALAGDLTIQSAINNTGALTVGGGTLAVNGAVSGTGTVNIATGVADFASTFTQNVTFTSTAGVLELARATAYTGSITGFSKTGSTSLDLLNVGFTSGTTKATYSGTTASGILTVTDGTHTAKIHLVGDYTPSTFTVSSDGHGGTSVVDPTAAPLGRTPPMLPLVNAMAGFAARGASPAAFGPDRRASPVLAAAMIHAP